MGRWSGRCGVRWVGEEFKSGGGIGRGGVGVRRKRGKEWGRV